MSLRQVNSQLLAEKADVVIRCLDRIKVKCPPTLKELEASLDAQDILTLNLERAIQACVDIASHVIAYTALPTPQTMAESFICLHQAGLID